MDQASSRGKINHFWHLAGQQWRAFMHHVQMGQYYAQKLMENSPEQNPFQRLQAPMLQLRLDNMDVIRELITFHRSFCNVLGIDTQHSALDNLNQIKYLIGNEDIDRDLSLLGHMLSDLEKVYDISHKNYLHQLEHQRLQKQLLQKILQQLRQDVQSSESLNELLDFMNDADTERYDETQSISFIERYYFNLQHELVTALELQAMFQYSLEQLTESMQVYEGDFKLSASEYDHIASLRGPIDKFYTAIVNGVVVLQDLFSLFFDDNSLQVQQAKTILTGKAQQLKQQTQNLINLQQQNMLRQQNHKHLLNQKLVNLKQYQLTHLSTPPVTAVPVLPQQPATVVGKPSVVQSETPQQQQSQPPLKNPSSATDLSYTSSLRRWLSPY
jgi:hypothetical protein